MSDRSAATLIIWGVTEKNVEALTALLADWEPCHEQEVPKELARGPLGARFYTSTALGTVVTDIGNALEAIDGVSYWISQEAHYTWDGIMRAYFPDLGRYESLADQNGKPLIPGDRILRVADDWLAARDPVSPLHMRLRDLCGEAWISRREELEEAGT